MILANILIYPHQWFKVTCHNNFKSIKCRIHINLEFFNICCFLIKMLPGSQPIVYYLNHLGHSTFSLNELVEHSGTSWTTVFILNIIEILIWMYISSYDICWLNLLSLFVKLDHFEYLHKMKWTFSKNIFLRLIFQCFISKYLCAMLQ